MEASRQVHSNHTPIRAADLSRERRRHVLNLLKRQGIVTSSLSDSARLTYVVGALVCDDTGYLKKDSLVAAFQDPSVVQAARTLLAKAVA